MNSGETRWCVEDTIKRYVPAGEFPTPSSSSEAAAESSEDDAEEDEEEEKGDSDACILCTRPLVAGAATVNYASVGGGRRVHQACDRIGQTFAGATAASLARIAAARWAERSNGGSRSGNGAAPVAAGALRNQRDITERSRVALSLLQEKRAAAAAQAHSVTPECSHGHTMVVSENAKRGYRGGYFCDRCGSQHTRHKSHRSHGRTF